MQQMILVHKYTVWLKFFIERAYKYMNKIETETICVVATMIMQQVGCFCNNIDRMFNY